MSTLVKRQQQQLQQQLEQLQQQPQQLQSELRLKIENTKNHSEMWQSKNVVKHVLIHDY